MSTLFPSETLQDSTYTWLPKVTVKTQLIYTASLAALVIALAALPFIKVDVSANASGLVRPVAEKNELHNLVSGTIEEILVTEGQHVEKGQLLIRLQQDLNNNKLSQTSFELQQREEYIHDLTLLTSRGRQGIASGQLHSPLYRQQYSRYQQSLSDQKTTLQRAQTNYEMYKQLFEGKVISQKEFLDRKYDYEKAESGYRAIVEQQHSSWEDDLGRYQVESGRLNTDTRQYQKEKEWNLIKAPVSGTLQQFNGKYAGGSLQPGELVGVISPDASLVAECYLSPKDIGYIRIAMPVKFQVDAFNYNEWGLLEGKVISIDNDFTLSGNQPVFKVKCSFDNTSLKLKNGIKGQLKKGMSLRARFILTRRSLFQLLFDRTDDWINPELNPPHEN